MGNIKGSFTDISNRLKHYEMIFFVFVVKRCKCFGSLIQMRLILPLNNLFLVQMLCFIYKTVVSFLIQTKRTKLSMNINYYKLKQKPLFWGESDEEQKSDFVKSYFLFLLFMYSIIKPCTSYLSPFLFWFYLFSMTSVSLICSVAQTKSCFWSLTNICLHSWPWSGSDWSWYVNKDLVHS